LPSFTQHFSNIRNQGKFTAGTSAISAAFAVSGTTSTIGYNCKFQKRLAKLYSSPDYLNPLGLGSLHTSATKVQGIPNDIHPGPG
jgi:hypothetical protein